MDQRSIRVFVSSTFRDMHEEREELVKRIFPQLRKLCESRNVSWTEVDLRWGINDEQKAEGKVLPICLEEIKRCRPYFIGILGERYGWVPDSIPKELMAQEEWLKEHLHHSVTELEILHGVLNNKAMADHAFFYFRDSAYLNSLSADLQKEFQEVEEGRKQKLIDLKQRIRDSGFPVRENYPTPEELGQLVLKDMTDVINSLFPEGEIDPLDRLAMEHEAFAQSRTRVYIGRQEYFNKLNDYVESDSQPLVVIGESGSGKSALLANWALKYREDHPNDLVIMHFIGASPYSTDWSAMLRRIMGELKRKFGIEQEIPDKPDKLRLAFTNYLSMASVKGRFVLIIDALNQLEDRDGAPDLVWLPPVIPANVRMILSSLPGRPLDDLKKRRWETLEIKPLNDDERKELIIKYLGQYTKSLNKDETEQIASADQTANPLFLRALLDELRVFGVYERLDERISHYLSAKDIPDLYERILTRYEEDYEKDRKGLVKDATSLIWASQRGLSESELMDLLGERGEPLPRAFWSPLYLASEQSLVTRSGLIGFFHDYLRSAVQRKYLKTEDDQRKAHNLLADYFARQELNTRKINELAQTEEWKKLYNRLSDLPFFRARWKADEFDVKLHNLLTNYFAEEESNARKIDEQPWQLAQAKEWKKLYDLLSDLPFFNLARKSDKFEAYWTQIESNSSLRIVEAYKMVLDSPEEYPDYVWNIAGFFYETGNMEPLSLLIDKLIKHYRKTGDKLGLTYSLGNQAVIMKDRGDLNGAIALFKEGERICRELDDRQGLAVSLGNQADILYSQGDLNGAMAMYKEMGHISKKLGNKQALGTSLGDQAKMLYSQGDLNGAMALLKEAERICRELDARQGLADTLGSQASILYSQGDLNGAMAMYKEAERVCREMGNKRILAISLGNQASILYSQGDLNGAMAMYKEAERISKELGNKQGLWASISGQAVILDSQGDLNGAMALHKEEERICREMGDKQRLAESLGNQAVTLSKRGDLDDAMMLLKEQEHMCKELGNIEGIARSLANQSLLLTNEMNQLLEGLPLVEEAYRLAHAFGLTLLESQIKPILDSIRLAHAFGLTLLENQIEPILDSIGEKEEIQTPIPSSSPHPSADPERAYKLNLEYQKKLADWEALPWWKRLKTKKPEPPTGI